MSSHFRSSRRKTALAHAFLLLMAVLSLLPFLLVVLDSFRSSTEIAQQVVDVPNGLRQASSAVVSLAHGGHEAPAQFHSAMQNLFNGYRTAWPILKPYMLNTIFVCGSATLGVLVFGSAVAFVLSRYRFTGSRFVYLYFTATMMVPGVLTLVPCFLIVRDLGWLNSYAGLIVPYVASGQVFAVFILRSFFDSVPDDLFAAARIDGAGPWRTYLHIALPLTTPALAVVAMITLITQWNNFLWPFVANTDQRYYVMASGLYAFASSEASFNLGVLYAGYVISAVPLLILFAYGNKALVQGLMAGGVKM